MEITGFFLHSALIKINITLAHINTTNCKEICSSNFQLAKLDTAAHMVCVITNCSQ